MLKNNSWHKKNMIYIIKLEVNFLGFVEALKSPWILDRSPWIFLKAPWIKTTFVKKREFCAKERLKGQQDVNFLGDHESVFSHDFNVTA